MGGHRISVHSVRSGRKYEYRCTCGAIGWEVATRAQAKEMARQHQAKAKTR